MKPSCFLVKQSIVGSLSNDGLMFPFFYRLSVTGTETSREDTRMRDGRNDGIMGRRRKRETVGR